MRTRLPRCRPHATPRTHPNFRYRRRVFERGLARVVVDATSLELLRGSSIGWEDEMVGQRFVVLNNPNADAGCGCGVSFAPKADAPLGASTGGGVDGDEEDDDD